MIMYLVIYLPIYIYVLLLSRQLFSRPPKPGLLSGRRRLLKPYLSGDCIFWRLHFLFLECLLRSNLSERSKQH